MDTETVRGPSRSGRHARSVRGTTAAKEATSTIDDQPAPSPQGGQQRKRAQEVKDSEDDSAAKRCESP